MLGATARRQTISHTRNADLANLAGLCLVLHEHGQPLAVAQLAQAAIDHAIFEDNAIVHGGRLPTRINHHMIALRELQLVTSVRSRGHVWYRLTPAGESIVDVAKAAYGNGALCLTEALREAWRPVLVQSDYVRWQWLKYFMARADFTYPELLTDGEAITILRLPMAQREDGDDSGYRIVSTHWDEQLLNSIERREIYEGLRRWTNEAYLTDDRLPPEFHGPFLHRDHRVDDVTERESHVVRAWLSPEEDLDLFEDQIWEILDLRGYGNRITIPGLIIALCDHHDYAKGNVREMLVALYYERGDRYVFERASRFLMRQAFKDAKSDDYYVRIEGVWRTGLVCY